MQTFDASWQIKVEDENEEQARQQANAKSRNRWELEVGNYITFCAFVLLFVGFGFFNSQTKWKGIFIFGQPIQCLCGQRKNDGLKINWMAAINLWVVHVKVGGH